LHISHSMGIQKHRQAGHSKRRGSAVACRTLNAEAERQQYTREQRSNPMYPTVAALFGR